jgi:hypothetical protein
MAWPRLLRLNSTYEQPAMQLIGRLLLVLGSCSWPHSGLSHILIGLLLQLASLSAMVACVFHDVLRSVCGTVARHFSPKAACY